MKLPFLGLALGAASCTRETTPSAAYELRPVAAAAVEALEAQRSAPPTVPGDSAAEPQRIEEILGALRSGDAGLRALAVEDARSLSPASVAQLVLVLRDAQEQPVCRTGVAEILAAQATREGLEALCAAAESAPEPWLRAQCAYRLGGAGQDRFLPRLLLRLKYEKDYETAFWLADACSRFGHLAGLEAMFVVWNGTSDEALRARVARRTSELARERGAEDPGDLLARWKAGTIAPGAPRFEPSTELRLAAWRLIRDLGEWDLRTVDDARYVLSHFEGWIVPLLAEGLHESSAYVRIHAAQCLERMGPRARPAQAALIAALAEPRTAPAAAAALGALGDPSAAGALEGRLLESADPELRVATSIALGALASPSSLPSLRRAFHPAQPFDLRQAAAAAILRIEEAPDALAFLLECMTEERGDAGAAELALGAWVLRRGERDPSAALAGERWKALDPPPGSLPSESDLRQRRGERAALARQLLR